jgi:hypothetical protein
MQESISFSELGQFESKHWVLARAYDRGAGNEFGSAAVIGLASSSAVGAACSVF